MADRFWVGGSGTWAPSVTTNWSATSGGPSGASVPTTADDVIFDQFGTYTVTMSSGISCQNFIMTVGGTVTFTSVANTLTISGGMELTAGTVWSTVSTITFTSSIAGNIITTNGTALSGNVTFNGTGTWTLGSALTLSTTGGSGLTITRGEFFTNGQSVTCAGPLQSSGSLVRGIYLGASTVTISDNTTAALNILGTTNLTFDAGTSQINLSGPTSGLNVPGLTFHNVAFTSSSGSLRVVAGSNTFNNFAVTAPSSVGVINVTIPAQQTINGTLSTTGTAGNRRVFFASATYGISYDLVVNSAPSLTDADFRGLYVRGTAAPISGTRIGNRGECRGITFDAPKTVYWNLGVAGIWDANGWAATSGGAPNTAFFPLPQDTAVIDNASSGTSVIIGNVALPNIDCSTRTTAFGLSINPLVTAYGNWTNGSGITISGGNTITFSGGTTQTITSAGKTFSSNISVDTYGGTVQLADALNIGANTLTVTNGTFNTAGYNITAGSLISTNSNVRTINFGASTFTSSSAGQLINFTISTNLTFNAGTSQITFTTNGTLILSASNQTFYNFSSTGTSSGNLVAISGSGNTFNNITVTAPNSGLINFSAGGNQTINGTLTCAGASSIQRIFLRSDTIGTPRTLTVNAISATDCDFRDITLAGAAAGASPTRAGDCGGNTGITFPAPKTVYWNLAGGVTWSATGWATSSGGTPAVDNFPLAQDTAVFDDTGSAGTVQVNAAWNIGTFDASLRTSAMTFNTSSNSPVVYGDWKFGTGVTSSSASGTINFSKNGTQTITSNGVQFGCPVTISHPLANVQLADALSLNSLRTLTVGAGTFDAVTYNVTIGVFFNSSSANTIRMGSGTWTLSGTGTVWQIAGTPTLIAGTSTIVLSDTSTNARTFAGQSLYYNKLTIGGTTGASTLTITGNNVFGELASTKTVAHTIAFGTAITTFGKWTVTGTAGNVVTITGTSSLNVIAGPAVTGVDYLAMGTWGISTTSPGEFYAGANSTGTAAAPVFRTATPAPRTLYWVGGTGNWSSTTKWSTSSGGGSGAAIPTSLDAVIFNSASNATAYTATIDAGVTLARCASFTMAGPASGNVTFAGTVPIAFHGNVSFAATGITRTYTGTMNWAGNSSYTFTTNGLGLNDSCTVNGIGSTWTLGSAFTNGNFTFTVTYGTFSTSTSNYSFTNAGAFNSNNGNVRSILLNASIVTVPASASQAVLISTITNLTFNAGTSQINLGGAASGLTVGGLTFNNVSFTSAAATSITITGANTFNTLSFAGRTTIGINSVNFSANQTITTLTLNAGTASAYRTFLASNTIGTQRTLNVTTLTAGAADTDFRDIAITGAAAPLTGTQFGDAKGNSGVTFPAAKTVYWALANSNNWATAGTGSWSATSGGSAAANQFPLAQDTAFIPFAIPNNNTTISINANYNIGTLDMNERNGSALLTLATGSTAPQIYGNWINGTGTTLSGTGTMTFAGRGAQTITSAGKTFTQNFTINSPGGSVALQDALVLSLSSSSVLSLVAGVFDANNFNVTLTGASSGVASSSTISRTFAVGQGTWTIAGTGGWDVSNAATVNTTGTGTITFTSASSKTFLGGGVSYSTITINQGGAGTLAFQDSGNTFKDITNTYSATGATTISLGATTQTVTQWSGKGGAGRLLTLSGTSAASPATLVISGAVNSATDYMSISNVRGYPVASTWYIGANSTNSGSLGFIFAVAAGGNIYNVTITETVQGLDALLAVLALAASLQESAQASDQISAQADLNAASNESAQFSEQAAAQADLNASSNESAQVAESQAASLSLIAAANESAQVSESQAAQLSVNASSSEFAQASDQAVSQANLNSAAAETAQSTDQAVSQATVNSAAAETARVADTASAAAVLFGAITDAATGTEVSAAFVVLPVSVAETARALDQLSGGLLFISNIAELATCLDSVFTQANLNSSAVEATQGADQAAVAASTFGAQANELSRVSETQTAAAVLVSSLVEQTRAQDNLAVTVVIFGAVSEAANAIESLLAGSGYFVNIVEQTTAVDTASALGSLTGIAAETARGTDTGSAQAQFPTNISELAVVQEVNSVTAAIQVFASEFAQATELPNPAGSEYKGVTLESLTAVDALRRAKIRVVFVDDFSRTSADTLVLGATADVSSVDVSSGVVPNTISADVADTTLAATVAGNSASSTVESGQITATVLP